MKKSEEFLKQERGERKAETRRRYVAARKWERAIKKTKLIKPYFNPETQQIVWGTNRQDFLTTAQNH